MYEEPGQEAIEKLLDKQRMSPLDWKRRTRNGKVHFVVVYNLTRFAREKYDHFALRAP